MILAVAALILAIVACALALLLPPERLNLAVVTAAVGLALLAAETVFG